ncbi:hypothetical protein GIB67_039594, partial [Kingdonia uniflora]
MMHFVCPFCISILSILCNNVFVFPFCMSILCNDAFCMSIFKLDVANFEVMLKVVF